MNPKIFSKPTQPLAASKENIEKINLIIFIIKNKLT